MVKVEEKNGDDTFRGETKQTFPGYQQAEHFELGAFPVDNNAVGLLAVAAVNTAGEHHDTTDLNTNFIPQVETEEEMRNRLRKELTSEIEKEVKGKYAAMAELLIDAAFHGMKSPVSLLSTTLYFLEKAQGEDDPEMRNKLLARVHTQLSVATASLTEEVSLQAAHLLGVEYKSTHVNQVAQSIISRFKHDPRKAEAVDFSVQAAGNHHLLVDQKRVGIILTNLIENAMAHTVEGSIVVRIDGSPSVLLLEVSDQGCGIPQESIPRIFQKGISLSAEETPRRKEVRSTGRGMYIIGQLVQQLEGKIEVQSVVGEGTTFTVKIPTQVVA